MGIKRFRPGVDDRLQPTEQTQLGGISPASGVTRDGRAKPARLNAPVFARLCEVNGVPRPVHQWRGHPWRQFIYDFAWPALRVALEVDGGIYPGTGGRRGAHGSVSGILSDMQKQNETAIAGILMLRVPFDRYLDTDTVLLVRRALDVRRRQIVAP